MWATSRRIINIYCESSFVFGILLTPISGLASEPGGACDVGGMISFLVINGSPFINIPQLQGRRYFWYGFSLNGIHKVYV